MLILTAVQAAAALGAGYLGAGVAMKIGHRLRRELFAQVQAMSTQEIGIFGTSSLVTRATNDVQQIQTFAVLVFTMLAAAPACGRCWRRCRRRTPPSSRPNTAPGLPRPIRPQRTARCTRSAGSSRWPASFRAPAPAARAMSHAVLCDLAYNGHAAIGGLPRAPVRPAMEEARC